MLACNRQFKRRRFREKGKNRSRIFSSLTVSLFYGREEMVGENTPKQGNGLLFNIPGSKTSVPELAITNVKSLT